MTSVMRSIFPASSSTSMEYSGPPIKYDIIQGFRLMFDVRCIPTVAVAAKVLSNLSLPVIQPIVKSKHSEKKLSNGQQTVMKPSRSDDVLDANEQLLIMNCVRAQIKSMMPKRPIESNLERT
ncbi:extra-large guanine nucleotide-binding protein 1 [Forsythia ovata]|uniref:Extra-large guanine nucleotide-binding protein 1 n=1 Tax=Forsythia ovata TaxID=205694 RepID=A0ABD1WZV0_9LAMI